MRREHCTAEPIIVCATCTFDEPTDHQIPINECLASRMRAGLEIDPDTAEVKWPYGYELPLTAFTWTSQMRKNRARVLAKETLAKLRESGRELRALKDFVTRQTGENLGART